MAVSGEPEILRCSLTSSILNLKCLGQNLEELDLMDMPDQDSGELFLFIFEIFVDHYYFLSCICFEDLVAARCH
jgi:hypothetical protein